MYSPATADIDNTNTHLWHSQESDCTATGSFITGRDLTLCACTQQHVVSDVSTGHLSIVTYRCNGATLEASLSRDWPFGDNDMVIGLEMTNKSRVCDFPHTQTSNPVSKRMSS